MIQEVGHPFDAAAPSYDDDFTHRRLGVWLREMVREYIPFNAGEYVLELGCGTGEDALWMAQQGIHVTATDVSSGMLKKAEAKCVSASIRNLPVFVQFDMNRAGLRPAPINNITVNEHDDTFGLDRKFDGIFSNFGAVNCVEDRQQLAVFLSDRVKPGGQVSLVVMSPVCPWEIGWHLLHGQVRTAFRRFKAGIPAHVGDGESVQVWYPSPRTLRREFAPYFLHKQTIGMGTLLPPSYLDHLVERFSITFEWLMKLDRRYGQSWFMQSLNDHYLIILERV